MVLALYYTYRPRWLSIQPSVDCDELDLIRFLSQYTPPWVIVSITQFFTTDRALRQPTPRPLRTTLLSKCQSL